MPTRNQHFAVTEDEARCWAGLAAFPEPVGVAAEMRVGLEPELFPIVVGASGEPLERLVLSRPGGTGVVQVIDGLAFSSGEILPRVGRPPHAFFYPLANGGRLTFEPGAQVEHSTAVQSSASAALADVKNIVGLLRRGFSADRVRLAAVGLDIWHEVEEVPQQLRAGRYTAQAAYYRQRGHWGAIMMRHTASLQINLDLGPEGVWQERWLASNLVSPMLTAIFACSPDSDAVSARARAWQQLDPTRSGFPALFTVGPGNNPRAEWAEAALCADVMLIRAGDDHFVPGAPGLRFVDWIHDGHPRHGWPTTEDLAYHLTTLFFEVRARGFLEMRAGEAVPEELRPAQVVLASALIYDDRARTDAIALLGGQRTDLDALWRRAAADGVHDGELRDLACRLWEIALAGAQRLPSGWVSKDDLTATRAFIDDYTARGRVPADRLAELMEEDPARALAWAASAL